MHEAFKNETAHAQQTTAGLHRQVQSLQEQLGAARSAQARLQGELRDAERRLGEAGGMGGEKEHDLVKTNAPGDQLAQGHALKAELREGDLVRGRPDARSQQKRINGLQLAIKKLRAEVASLHSIMRARLDMPVVPSSSLAPARQSQQLRRAPLSAVPAAFPPQAVVTPVLSNHEATMLSGPAGSALRGEPSAPLSALGPIPRSLAAPVSPAPETSRYQRFLASAPSASSSALPLRIPRIAVKPILMSIRPSEGTALRGLETRVDILVANVIGLVESTVTLRYDPKVLEFRQAFDGEFLHRDGAAAMIIDSNPVAGTVVLKLKRGGDSKGVSGDGVLVTVAFAGKTAGLSSLAIQSAKFLNDNRVVLPVSGWPAAMRVE